MSSGNNFESTYIYSNSFLKDYFFLQITKCFLGSQVAHLRNTELDINNFSCSTECLIRQSELNISESNYHAIKIYFIKKPNSLFYPSVIIILFKHSRIQYVVIQGELSFVAMFCDFCHYYN